MTEGLLILPGCVVEQVLAGQTKEVLAIIAETYRQHGLRKTAVPRASVLFVEQSRFIAMPSAIQTGEQWQVGLKWVASAPANVPKRKERASAVLIVNDAASGRPAALMDGTLISALRTAASAALVVAQLSAVRKVSVLGLIGCGPINHQVLRFVTAVLGPVDRVLLTDINDDRVREFSRRVAQAHPDLAIDVATVDAVLQESDHVSIATTATQPFIHALPRRAMTVLHISLRDLAPEVILNATNIVDDAEHVCSERTSIHLAAQAAGHTQFIHSTIPDLLLNRAKPLPADTPIVVSPFGLSILDLALARFVLARAQGIDSDSVFVPDFVGTSWSTGEASQ